MEGIEILYLILACPAWAILLRYFYFIYHDKPLLEQRPPVMYLFGILAAGFWISFLFIDQEIWRSVLWIALSMILFLLPSGISKDYIYISGSRRSWKKYNRISVTEKGNYYRLLIKNNTLYYKKESCEKLRLMLEEICQKHQIEITKSVLEE